MVELHLHSQLPVKVDHISKCNMKGTVLYSEPLINPNVSLSLSFSLSLCPPLSLSLSLSVCLSLCPSLPPLSLSLFLSLSPSLSLSLAGWLYKSGCQSTMPPQRMPEKSSSWASWLHEVWIHTHTHPSPIH